MKRRCSHVLLVLGLAPWPAIAAGVAMNAVDATDAGAPLGEVAVAETPYGVVFTPSLAGLAPGLHGFHVHENGDCKPQQKDGKAVAGLAAGGHYDPDKSGRHGTPWGDGHRGDLPPLHVDADGKAASPVRASRAACFADAARRQNGAGDSKRSGVAVSGCVSSRRAACSSKRPDKACTSGGA